MARNELAYIPALKGFNDPPLGRFLPLLPRGVVAQWLETNSQPGSLIMDPLGANPNSAIEAARSSHRVLFARNNPIIWLILEALASAPTEKQVRSLVGKLLLSRQMEETLDSHLQAIYATTCADCGKRIQPKGYIWEEKKLSPVAKVYLCPHCGDAGERPITEQDINNLERLGNIGLHRTRAFQRVMQGGDYEKETIESALNCYLPRAIYVAMLLVNRLDSLILNMPERKLLQAILISVFDDATSLWHWPERDHRHLQLALPSRFIEKNLWKSLDSAPNTWGFNGTAVPISYWPNLPPRDGGICLYQRRLAEQTSLLENEKPHAIISVFPRPNQAFWTLSALWSGWLWGRKGVTPMRSALSRRRYDWHWFAQAINATFKPLTAGLLPQTQVLGIFPQITANFYLGLQAGMCSAGFEAIGAAYRAADDLIQCQWELRPREAGVQAFDFKASIADFLNNRGEPANFIEIMPHCLTELALSGNLNEKQKEVSDTLFSQVQEEISSVLRDGQFALSFASSLPGGSQWWLSGTRSAQLPLTERVEAYIRKKMLEGHPIDRRDLELQVCRHFLGSNTPPAELITLCLESYADPISRNVHQYMLQPEENIDCRDIDLEELQTILALCAQKLGLNQEVETNSIIWKSPENQILYRFWLTVTCALSEIILDFSNDEKIMKVVIFPGSRSRLLAYRIKHDPRLDNASEQNWIFVKFRTLRRVSQQENLTLDLWKELLNSDPPLWDPPVQSQLL